MLGADIMRSSYRTIGISLLISLLLHLLLLFVSPDASWMNAQVPSAAEESEPLEFVLQQPERPKQIVETPKEGEVDEPVESDLLSDINSRARDDVDASEESDLPRVDGVAPVPSLPSGAPSAAAGAEAAEEGEQGDGEGETGDGSDRSGEIDRGEMSVLDSRPGSREGSSAGFLRKGSSGESSQRTPQRPSEGEQPAEQLPSTFDTFSAPMRNPNSTSAGIGNITLNTTAWDFAPYIYDLKRRIVRSWFPPYAFTAMGLIWGHTKVRWKIYPDGHTEGIHIVEQDGHESLHSASRGAVRGAQPFKPLPPDFPEPYLDITFGFYYIVPGKNDASVPR